MSILKRRKDVYQVESKIIAVHVTGQDGMMPV